MRIRRLWLLLAIVSPALGLFVSGRAAEPDVLTPQARADFEWFSSLGFPDPKGCPCVRVATGQWYQSGDEPPKNRFLTAFLLATNGPRFQVFSMDLRKQTLVETNVEGKSYAKVGFDILTVTNEVAEQLRAWREATNSRPAWPLYLDPSWGRIGVFALGWACWRNGLETEAGQLYEQALKMPSQFNRNQTAPNFRQGLELDLGYLMMWRAILDFGDPAISRPQLLTQFEAIVTNYPHSEYRERARQTAEVLRRMIAEDEAHANVAPANLDQLPVEQQVRELIFRLRDQNGQQSSQPGDCDIFENMQGSTNTPAHQLVRLGYAAVPQLIVALDDPTFSRSVGYWRDFTFSHTVLTVGDCAQAILQRISGKSFFEPRSTFSYMSMDGQASAARKAAETWWAEFQRKGEQEMLIEALASPGDDAPAQAKILRQRYPQVAAAAIIRGAQAATNAWIRVPLVEETATLDEPQVTAFLRGELTNGPFLEARVAAAHSLLGRAKDEAVQAMIHEWEINRSQKPGDPDDLGEVAGFLAGADSVPAIQALGKDLRQRPVDIRMQVMESIGDGYDYYHETVKPSPAALNAIEDFLITELEDQEERMGASGTRNGKSYSDPRMCDMAGLFLNDRWPERYNFDLSASRLTRDRQRVECQNVWRRAHDLPALPLPVRPAQVRPEQATQVTAIQWVEGSAKPSVRFAAKMEAFKNRSPDAKQLAALLASFVAAPESGTAGIEILARKDEDLVGVVLAVRLLPVMTASSNQTWNVNEAVILGRKSLLGEYGSGIPDAYSSAERWDDFVKAAAQALAADPTTPFEISAHLELENRRE